MQCGCSKCLSLIFSRLGCKTGKNVCTMSNPLWSINSQRSPDKQHNFDPQMLSSKITAFSLEFYYRIHKTGFELWVPKQFPDFKYFPLILQSWECVVFQQSALNNRWSLIINQTSAPVSFHWRFWKVMVKLRISEYCYEIWATFA